MVFTYGHGGIEAADSASFFSRSMMHRTDERMDWKESVPLALMHVACLAVFWTGAGPAALGACAVMYVVRVFGLTGGYHRYFSHHAFKTGRVVQFLLAWMGASAAQRGPLWWASHHRHHHRFADQEDDIHSPSRRGFFWAHLGWLLCPKYAAPRLDLVQDFAKYPELRFLDRHAFLAPAVLAALLFGAGEALKPWGGANGPRFLAWGFFVSTVLVYHVTFCINSVMHMAGTRRYDTSDTSRNNAVLAVLSMGEGWHNNHHRYAVAARQGFFWWEVDLTYYVLRLLAAVGLVWDVREPPSRLLREFS